LGYEVDMRSVILLAALLAAPAAAAPSQPAAKGPWLDWSELSRRAAAAQPAVPDRLRPEADARALGDRVGQMVAAGDCRGGERMAMEAGDSALVRAVRNYCRS
jgi:hypothetical protein